MGDWNMDVTKHILVVVGVGLLAAGCEDRHSVQAVDDGTVAERAGQQVVLEFPGDLQPMKFEWTAVKPDPNASIQVVEELILNHECTYESESRDLLDGQTAEKSLWWAIHARKQDDKAVFPAELMVEMDKPIAPYPGCPAVMDRTSDRTQLCWKVDGPLVPSRFGEFGYKTQGTIRGVEIRRQCQSLGDGRAQITITVHAPVGLLIRVWGLHGAVQVEPQSIVPEKHKLSDNGVLFFDYGKDWQTRGIESEYSFIVSGLKTGQLYYPQTNVLEQIYVQSPENPAGPVTRVRGSGWGFDFTLRSDQPFRVLKSDMRVSHLYELKPLWIEP